MLGSRPTAPSERLASKFRGMAILVGTFVKRIISHFALFGPDLLELDNT